MILQLEMARKRPYIFINLVIFDLLLTNPGQIPRAVRLWQVARRKKPNNLHSLSMLLFALNRKKQTIPRELTLSPQPVPDPITFDLKSCRRPW